MSNNNRIRNILIRRQREEEEQLAKFAQRVISGSSFSNPTSHLLGSMRLGEALSHRFNIAAQRLSAALQLDRLSTNGSDYVTQVKVVERMLLQSRRRLANQQSALATTSIPARPAPVDANFNTDVDLTVDLSNHIDILELPPDLAITRLAIVSSHNECD